MFRSQNKNRLRFSSGIREGESEEPNADPVWCPMRQRLVDMRDCDGKFDGVECPDYDRCRKRAHLPVSPRESESDGVAFDEKSQGEQKDDGISWVSDKKVPEKKDGWSWD